MVCIMPNRKPPAATTPDLKVLLERYGSYAAIPASVWHEFDLETLRQEQERRLKETHNPLNEAEYQQWLDGIVPLREGAKMRGCSVDTLRREATKGRIKLQAISQRKFGIRRREALNIPAGDHRK